MNNGSHSHTNGHASWLNPSPELAILLDVQRRIGGLETGQNMTLHAVETSFGQIDDLQGRVTTLEARRTETRSAHRPWWRDTGISLKEAIGLIVAIAVGVTALVQGKPVKDAATDAASFYRADK